MAKVGFVLSGCGVYDGSEIYEGTLALLALDIEGAEVTPLAPNIDQMHVIDHGTGEPIPAENRSVIQEAARLARGPVTDIATVSADDFDALVFPGGFGAAKNLSDFAVAGPDCTVNKDVANLVQGMVKANKPVGFMCISPAIAAKVIGDGVQVTLGQDDEWGAKIDAMGAKHVKCSVDQIVHDQKLKVVSTPAFMEAQSIKDVWAGVQPFIKKVLELA